MTGVIDVVVSCSNRKRYPVPSSLSLHTVQKGAVDRRASNWLSKLKTYPVPPRPAAGVYGGDHWSVVRGLAGPDSEYKIRRRVWICSAGYGLIPYNAWIKPYAATFASGHRDSVSLGKSSDQIQTANQSWWQSLALSWEGPSPGTPRSLHAIPTLCGRAPMLIALSSDYLSAVLKDIEQLLSNEYYREHLAIVSCGTTTLDGPLGRNLLPCDARMQGAVGGVRASLNVRIAAHLLGQLRHSSPSYATLFQLCQRIEKKPIAKFRRKTLSDDRVRAFISRQLGKDQNISRTSLLSLLRRQKFACEHSRFTRLYHSIAHSTREVIAHG